MKRLVSRWLGVVVIALVLATNYLVIKATGHPIPHFEAILFFLIGGTFTHSVLSIIKSRKELDDFPMDYNREIIFELLYNYAGWSSPIIEDLLKQQTAGTESPIGSVEPEQFKGVGDVLGEYMWLLEDRKDVSGVPDELRSLMKSVKHILE